MIPFLEIVRPLTLRRLTVLFPESQQTLAQDFVDTSVHRAWLTLEAIVVGPSFWQRVEAIDAFERHAETLLDLLNLTGAGLEDDASRERCRQEMILARQSGRLGLDDDAMLAEHDSIDPLIRELQQEGYLDLSRLLSLRIRQENLAIELATYFLSRQLDCASEWTQRWRCLESWASLFETDQALVEAWLQGEDKEAAPKSHAKEVDRLIQLGRRCIDDADYSQAITHFTAALKLETSAYELHIHRGDAYQLLGDYERAIADYSSVLEQDPDDASLWVSRAQAFQRLHEYDRAIADCDQALEIERQDPEAYRIRANCQSARGNIDQALIDLTAALNLARDDAESWYQRGLLWPQRGEFGRAIGDFTQAIQLNPHHVLAYLHRGHAHRSRADHTSAILDYSEVLRRHRRNTQAYSSRALAYELQGDLDKALADYGEAIKLESNDGRLYRSRGLLHRQQGNWQDALGDFHAAVDLLPEDWSARFHRGKAYLANGLFEEALTDLTEAIYLQPKLAVGYLTRALVLDRLDRFAEALADCQRATQREASAAGSLLRGMILVHAKEAARALADLNDAILHDPRLPLAWAERAALHHRLGNFDLALADFDRLLSLEPENAIGYAGRCLVHQALGNESLSLNDFSRAMKLDPTSLSTGQSPTLLEARRQQTILALLDVLDGIRRHPEVPEPAPYQYSLEKPQAAISTVAPTTEVVAVEIPPAPPPPSRIETRPRTDVVIRPKERTGKTDLMPIESPPSEPKPALVTAKPEPSPVVVATPAVAAVKPMCCPSCRRWSSNAETLADGRNRCPHCEALFIPLAMTKPLVAKKARSKPKPVAQASAPILFFQEYQRALSIAASVVLVLGFTIYFSYDYIGRLFHHARPQAVARGDRVTPEELFKKSQRDRRMSQAIGAYWAVTVTGEVESVDDADRVVYLKLPAKSPGKIACHLAYPDEISLAQPGQQLTIQGMSEGRDVQTQAVHVVSCQIIPPMAQVR